MRAERRKWRLSGADPALQPAAEARRDLVQKALGEERRARIEAVVGRRHARLAVVLEEIHDGHNQAAVLRTAESMGLLKVHVIEGPDTPYVPHRRVSVDAEKWIQVVRHQDAAACVRALKAEGLAIYAGLPGPLAAPLWDLDCTRPCAFVFGNEHRGLSHFMRASADRLFQIPMRGFAQSLNLSVAAAITLVHAVRQREAAGMATDLGEEERRELAARYELRAMTQYRRLVTGAPAQPAAPAQEAATPGESSAAPAVPEEE